MIVGYNGHSGFFEEVFKIVILREFWVNGPKNGPDPSYS